MTDPPICRVTTELRWAESRYGVDLKAGAVAVGRSWQTVGSPPAWRIEVRDDETNWTLFSTEPAARAALVEAAKQRLGIEHLVAR